MRSSTSEPGITAVTQHSAFIFRSGDDNNSPADFDLPQDKCLMTYRDIHYLRSNPGFVRSYPMRHPFSSPIRSLSVAGILAISAQVPAQAAITLTIDTLAKTFTWSGTATSGSVLVGDWSSKTIQLGIDSWTGGTYVSADGDGALGVSLPPSSLLGTSVTPDFYSGIPIVAVNPSNPFDPTNSIKIPLAEVEYRRILPQDPTSAPITLIITGDGQAYSYAGANQFRIDYLESLDGTELFFQDEQGGAGVFNIGSAGHIVVIPEPSSALLLIAAPFLFSLRRRRA